MCGTACPVWCCEEPEKDFKLPDGIVKLKGVEYNVRVHTYVSLELW
jgi:hypothetical protein